MRNKQLSSRNALQAERQVNSFWNDIKHNNNTYYPDNASSDFISDCFGTTMQRQNNTKNTALMSIYHFIGRPKYDAPEMIAIQEYEAAIEQLLTLLEARNIVIDRPNHLSPQDYYHFLVNDLLKNPISNSRIKGLVHTFSYHNFYQDAPDFIPLHAQEVVEDILDLQIPYQGVWLSEGGKVSQKTPIKTSVAQKVKRFRAPYQKIIPVAFQSEKIQRTADNSLYFTFGVVWEGVRLSDGVKEHYEGLGVCQMRLQNRAWLVESMMMPGFEF